MTEKWEIAHMDLTAPNLVADKKGFPVGYTTKWNPCGIGEIIVQYVDGSASSEFASDLNFPNGREQAYDWLNKREF